MYTVLYNCRKPNNPGIFDCPKIDCFMAQLLHAVVHVKKTLQRPSLEV